MISLDNFEVKKLSEDKDVTEFAIGPLPKGYGETLGNILRRVLLSSVPGAAITAVKLEGAQHEYSTLAGLSDDVLSIILSLKNVVVTSKSMDPVQVKIDVKGQNGKVVEVKAGEIEKTSDIEVVNKNYVITKLTSAKARFKAELTIERGVGYMLPQEDKRVEVNVIPVDAKFSPVSLVSYKIVQTRVGQRTDFDQLNISVTTNGSTTPSEVLDFSANIIMQMSDNLKALTAKVLEGKSSIPELDEKVEIKEKSGKETKAKGGSLVVKDMGLSTRLTNALLRSGYEDLGDLEGMAEEEIINIRGLGSKSVDELINTLKDNNIKIL